MSSLVTIVVPSGTRPGRLLTRLPVARITSVACRTRSPPAPGVPSSPAWLHADPVRARRAGRGPATQVTLFLSTRVLRPVHIRLTTASRRAAIVA